jgi:predicted MFS family arabinose efflux permease
LATNNENTGRQAAGRSLTIALLVVFFSIFTSNTIVALLSLDMAHTFFPASFVQGASSAAGAAAVGSIAQVVTANTIFEVFFAISMGYLAIRFKFRPLMLFGIGLVIVSAIGSYFAPTLIFLAFFSALEGGGTVIVGATGFSLVGEYLPFEKKAKTVSYLVAITMFVSLIGAPLVTTITNFGGWRLSYLLFSLPISVIGFFLAYLTLPRGKGHIKAEANTQQKEVLMGFKSVFFNKSAILTLVAGMLGGTSVMGTFALAFYRQQLGLPLAFASMVYMIATTMYILASLVVGRFVNRVGARKLGLVCAFANGLLMMIFFFMPVWYFALPLDMTHVWFGAAVFTSFQCLTLDQVPKFRPTMMSMRSLFLSLGAMIGAALGGIMLIVFGSYAAVGVLFGLLSIIAAIAFLGTKDTTKACDSTILPKAKA